MNILLITTLYPGYLNQSKMQATYAVHYFAKEWVKKNEVKVIRLWPYYPNIFKCFKKVKMMNRYAYEEKFILDDVSVNRVPILKIPKISYEHKDINLVSKKIVKTIIKDSNPDIIICDILNPSIYIGEKIAREYNSILVASLHNSDIFYLSNKKNYERFMKIDSNIDKIVFRSNKVENFFKGLYHGNKKEKDYFTILFGIDKSDIIDKMKLEKKILKPNKVIMVAASLKKLKKINILIEAFVRMENRNDYVLKIIGDGPERKRLEEQVNNLHCSNYVNFEGAKSRDEVLKLMEESEIFAMVSSPETFGLVYVEAMAKGCITIGSKGEGIDGVIINNENGFLCSPDDIEGLRETLENIISLNSKKRKRIVYNAINTAASLNNQNLSNEYLEKIIEKKDNVNL